MLDSIWTGILEPCLYRGCAVVMSHNVRQGIGVFFVETQKETLDVNAKYERPLDMKSDSISRTLS